MLTRRGTVAVAVAAALLACPGPAGAGHGDPPDGKEWSANGTFETRTVVLAHTHTNTYACRAAECVPGGDVRIEGVLDQTTTISCRLELFTTRTGCGHNSGGGWRFTGHNELLTGPWGFCNGQATIYDASHCGEWVDAAPSCPAGDTPRVSHRHASGAHTGCETHAVSGEPACPAPAPASGKHRWTWNPGSGHTSRSMEKDCPTEADPPVLLPACPSNDTPTVQHRHASGGHTDCQSHRPGTPYCTPGQTGTISWTWTPPGGGHAAQSRTHACVRQPCAGWWPIDVMGGAEDAAGHLRDPYHDRGAGAVKWAPEASHLGVSRAVVRVPGSVSQSGYRELIGGWAQRRRPSRSATRDQLLSAFAMSNHMAFMPTASAPETLTG